MIIALIIVAVIVVGIVAARMNRVARDRQEAAPPSQPVQPPISQVPVDQYQQAQPQMQPPQYQQPAPPPPPTTGGYTYQPPGTQRDLDDENAVRPDVDIASLQAARASVSQEVPDEILKDVLLDATPQQAAQLFSGVSHEALAGAIGQQTSGVHIQGQARAEDLAKLSSLSSAVDDLDIWNFGDDTGKSA